MNLNTSQNFSILDAWLFPIITILVSQPNRDLKELSRNHSDASQCNLPTADDHRKGIIVLNSLGASSLGGICLIYQENSYCIILITLNISAFPISWGKKLGIYSIEWYCGHPS